MRFDSPPQPLRVDSPFEPEAERLTLAYKKLECDPAQAISTMTGMAERGSLMSMLYLGYAYRNGTGVSLDTGCAERWFKRAAEAGFTRAYYELGRMYLDASEYSRARAELETAAARGFVPAVHFLGRMHYV